MYSESLEDQGSDKSNNGHMADYQAESVGLDNNGESHSDQLEQQHLSNQDEMDGYGSGCDDVEFNEAEMEEQQDDCDRDPLDEIRTPTQLTDRENEIPTIKTENGHSQQQQQPDQEIWYLPANREICTLEEIRRGQVINKTAGNECPVPGCGKKINESRVDPTPGTIASGLRTHVLFVHYGVSPNRKLAKKKKSLGWTSVARGLRTSPRKLATHTSQMLAATSRQQDAEIDYSNMNSTDITNTLSSLIQKSSAPMNLSRPDVDRRFKKSTIDNQQPNINQISSLQSLIQASGGQKTTTGRAPNKKQQDSSANQANQMNPVTSSLFSILAGITQQQQQQQQQPQQSSQLQTAPKNSRSNTHNNNNNSINHNNLANVPQNRSNANNNRPANSSLLSLLNEKISGNVAFSLQNQLRKTMTTESRNKSAASRQYSDPNSYLSQVNNNDTSYTNGGGRGGGGGTSILNGLISNNGDNRISLDNSIPINSFVETMASKTGSNIGPVGITQVKKMLEKFTASLLYSSQTIADHYLEPFGGEVMQQKPEISASDVILAYKMMLKTHGQP